MAVHTEVIFREEGSLHDLNLPVMSQSPANCAACTGCIAVRPRTVVNSAGEEIIEYIVASLEAEYEYAELVS